MPGGMDCWFVASVKAKKGNVAALSGDQIWLLRGYWIGTPKVAKDFTPTLYVPH